jgi:hypothetical protein
MQATKGPLARKIELPQIFTYLEQTKDEESDVFKELTECAKSGETCFTVQMSGVRRELLNIFGSKIEENEDDNPYAREIKENEDIKPYIEELENIYAMKIFLDYGEDKYFTLDWSGSGNVDEVVGFGEYLYELYFPKFITKYTETLLNDQEFCNKFLVSKLTGDYMHVHECSFIHKKVINIDLPEYGFNEIRWDRGTITFNF